MNYLKPFQPALRLLSLAALSLAVQLPASAQRYSVTDLGKDMRPCAINTSGQITGYHNVNGTSTYAFLWTPTTPGAATGTMSTLLTGNVLPASINAGGQVVGNQSIRDPSGISHQYPFVWTPDTANAATGSSADPNTLLPANSGWVLSSLGCINDAGVMYGGGTHTDASGVAVSESYLWQKDTAGNIVLTAILRGGNNRSLNNVVSPQTAAGRFIWQNEISTAISSSASTQSYSLNDVGQVAGYTTVTTYHAFVWRPDMANGTTSAVGIVDLHPTGYYQSYARGLNNAGQVVGSAQSASSAATALAVLWDGTGWHDLNTLCNPLPAGWKLFDAYGINNRTVSVNGTLIPAAQIVGRASITITTLVRGKTTTTTEEHGFLLTPQ